MKITIESSALQEAIRVAGRLAPPLTGNVTFESDGKKAFLHSASEVNRCSINMPCDVEGRATTFAIGLNALKDATKGRKTLEIVFDKTMCKIKSGNYACELPTVDALEIEATKEQAKTTQIKVTADQAVWLKSALTTVALKPTALLSFFMPVFIKLTSKGAFVTCYDSLHLAFMNSKEITGDMELTLPIDMMLAVLDTFNGAPFTLEVTQSTLYVSNKLVKVSLSLPQEEDGGIKGADVLEKAREVSKIDGSEIVVAKQEMLEFFDNARAVATKERSEVTMRTVAGKVRLEVNTPNGSSKGDLKADCKTKSTSKIDFEFLDEAVRKCPDSVSMKLVDGAFISFKLKSATVLVSLNQE